MHADLYYFPANKMINRSPEGGITFPGMENVKEPFSNNKRVKQSQRQNFHFTQNFPDRQFLPKDISVFQRILGIK